MSTFSPPTSRNPCPVTPSPPRNPIPATSSHPDNIDILILGAGWTSTFLFPLLKSHSFTSAATTTTGHPVPGHPSSTIPFTFEPDSDDLKPYHRLPAAWFVLITFPLKGIGQSRRLVENYERVHSSEDSAKEKRERKWIQLGSTGVWKGDGWHDRSSPIDLENARAVAEEELLAILGERACILNLAGLWGGERHPRHWISRVAQTKEEVKGKSCLHLVHGDDVAKGIVGCLEKWEGVGGGRWIVCDLRAWDWWDLILGWSLADEYRRWVLELMDEEGLKALPRQRGSFPRTLDGRDFWRAVGLRPARSLLT